MATQKKTMDLVVLGGNGYVGGEVCKSGLRAGYNVTSINRSGAPHHSEPWVENVEWKEIDVFDEDKLAEVLPKGSAVVSCIGAFGSNKHMERLCGDATITASNVARSAGVERFVFVSVHDYKFPSWLVTNFGYLNGKKRAEEAVLQNFPGGKGVVVRPSAVYGNRKVYKSGGGFFEVPLALIFRPIAQITSKIASWRRTRRENNGGLVPFGQPIAEFVLTSPVSSKALGDACVYAASGKFKASSPSSSEDSLAVLDELDLVQFDKACDFGRTESYNDPQLRH